MRVEHKCQCPGNWSDVWTEEHWCGRYVTQEDMRCDECRLPGCQRATKDEWYDPMPPELVELFSPDHPQETSPDGKYTINYTTNTIIRNNP